MSRNNDGLTLSQLGEINARLHSEVARLNEQVQALAALAEERREFIVNGVELGYIQVPTIPLDKAIGTYERCLLQPKFAVDAILNEVRAQGLDEAATEVDKWVGCDLLAQELRKKASRIRAREVPDV